MRLGITAVVLGLGLATGCGGTSAEGSTAPVSTASTTDPGVLPSTVLADPAAGAAAVAVIRTYLAAFEAGNAERICALETQGFAQSQLERAVALGFVKKGASCVDFVTKAVATSKRAAPRTNQVASYLFTAIEATASTATVRVEYPVASGAAPDTYRLVRTKGAWLIDENVGLPPA